MVSNSFIFFKWEVEILLSAFARSIRIWRPSMTMPLPPAIASFEASTVFDGAISLWLGKAGVLTYLELHKCKRMFVFIITNNNMARPKGIKGLVA